MKKKPSRSAASAVHPKKTQTPRSAPVDITVTPLVISDVSVASASVLTSVRGHLAGLRDISPSDTTKRAAKMQAVAESVAALDHEFAGLIRAAQAALLQHDSAPLLRIVDQFGLLGLWLVLADPDAMQIGQSWWENRLDSVNSAGGKQIHALARRLTKGIPGKKRAYTPTEQAARKAARNADDQRKFRAVHRKKK